MSIEDQPPIWQWQAMPLAWRVWTRVRLRLAWLLRSMRGEKPRG